jgi:hypothetical protein
MQYKNLAAKTMYFYKRVTKGSINGYRVNYSNFKKPENFKSMKKYFSGKLHFLFVAVLVIMAATATSQTRVDVNSTPVTDLNGLPLNPGSPGNPAVPFSFRWPLTSIVAPNPAASPVGALSSADPRGKCMIWLEYGDGGFTVQPVVIRNMTSSPPSAFLMATPLYDTTRGKDLLISRYLQGASLNPTGTARSSMGHNDPPLITAAEGIKLSANAYNIVPGEPMQIAFTYKLGNDMGIINTNGAKYYVLFYYNKNSSSIFAKYSINGAAAMPAYLRAYNKENFDALLRQQDFVLSDLPAGYGSFAAFELPVRDSAEYNFFITLIPNKNLKAGDKSTIVAALVNVNKDKERNFTRLMGKDSMSGIYVSRAFDPNTLTVTPGCLVLPKQETGFNYRVQFQNLGKGPADIVKIVVPLPAGLRRETIQMGDVLFAGAKVPNVVPVSIAGNSIEFTLTGYLPGTDGTANALTNPVTMGEVNFTIKSTAALEDSVKHNAQIVFHSKYAIASDWEDTVSTPTCLTVYKNQACECDNPPCPPDNCLKIFGLCWWWWVLILLAVIILLWLLLRRR